MVIAFFFLFGIVIGSFLNVCITRIPEEQSIIAPGSRCPRCHAAIMPYDNVPVFGWLWLRGKCRSCGLPISVMYPLVELLTGVLFVACYLEFGVTPKILFLGNTMLSDVSTNHLRTSFDPFVSTQNITSTFTWGGDATSYVQLNLGKCFSIRGGYNVLYINRVTRPQNNIYYNDNIVGPPAVVSNLIFRDLLVSGFTFGCQFTW